MFFNWKIMLLRHKYLYYFFLLVPIIICINKNSCSFFINLCTYGISVFIRYLIDLGSIGTYNDDFKNIEIYFSVTIIPGNKHFEICKK